MERQRKDGNGMDSREAYRKFKESRQEKLRLEIALQELLKDRKKAQKSDQGDIPKKGDCDAEGCGAFPKEYEDYIKLRIRPAMETLVRGGEVDKIEILARYGWIKEEQMEGFLRMALRQDNRAVLLCLLHLKNREFGFRDKVFLL